MTTTASSVRTVPATEVAAALSRGERLRLVDVRTPVEFAEVHARGAENIPLDRLDPAALRDDADTRPLYVICKSGSRAAKACQQLAEAGHGQIINVAGGTDAWVQAGLPVERRRVAIPLFRQTLIGAGLLVLLGVILGTWVNPWFYALSGFVGVGLLVAGLTGFCGMALLLARMPWNRYESASCSA